MNQTQGPTVATISAEPKTQDVDVAIFTHRGAMMGDDGTQSQVQLDGKKKVAFDIVIEKEIFFKTRDMIGRNIGKSHVYEILSSFDLSLEKGPSRHHGTL